MKMQKLRNVWGAILLGAINGLSSTAVLVALDRINLYYANLKYEEKLREVEHVYQETGTHLLLYNPQPKELWWINAALLNIAFFIIASLVVHTILAKRTKSVFLLWLLTGIVVIIEWGLMIIVVGGIESLITGRNFGSLLAISTSEMILWFVALTIVTSTISGMIVKAAIMQYRDKV